MDFSQDQLQKLAKDIPDVIAAIEGGDADAALRLLMGRYIGEKDRESHVQAVIDGLSGYNTVDTNVKLLEDNIDSRATLDALVDRLNLEALLGETAYGVAFYAGIESILASDMDAGSFQEPADTTPQTVRGALGFLLLAKYLDRVAAGAPEDDPSSQMDPPGDGDQTSSEEELGTIAAGAADVTELGGAEVTDLAKAEALFECPEVRNWFWHWYGLAKAPVEYAIRGEFPNKRAVAPLIHGVGTTSFTVACDDANRDSNHHSIALKCLIPRYTVTDSVPRGLMAQVRELKLIEDEEGSVNALDPDEWLRTHRVKVSHAPNTDDPRRFRFVALDFIPGPTLRQKLDDLGEKAALDPLPATEGQTRHREWRFAGKAAQLVQRKSSATLDRLDFVESLIKDICPTLSVLHRIHHPHRDLSPSNLIVAHSDSSATFSDVRLIDFGKNTLLGGQLGTGTKISDAMLYCAPELGDSKGDWRADAFALGMILLEILGDGPMSSYLEAQQRLDLLWEEEPALAEVVEDLIDKKPKNRLLGVQLPDSERALGKTEFDYLQTRVLAVIGERRDFHERRKSATSTFGLGALVRSDRSGTIDSLKRLGSELNALRSLKRIDPRATLPVDAENREGLFQSAYLAAFAALHDLLWAVFLTLVAGITLQEWPWWADHIGGTYNFVTTPSVVNEWRSHVFGRLVAFTTAFAAIAYYKYLFIDITTRGVVPRPRLAEVSMRAGMLVALGLQIYAFLLPGTWKWAALGGLGGLFVGLNNFLCLRLFKKAAVLVKGCDPGGPRYSTVGAAFTKTFPKIFEPWWYLMVVYSGGGLGIGILIWRHVVHDAAWLIALIMIAANVVALYGSNLRRHRATINGNLARAFYLLRREGRLPEGSASASDEAGSPISAAKALG